MVEGQHAGGNSWSRVRRSVISALLPNPKLKPAGKKKIWVMGATSHTVKHSQGVDEAEVDTTMQITV